MYPSPHRSSGPPTGLARYGSAPGSLLASIAESIISSSTPTPTLSSSSTTPIGSDHPSLIPRFFSADSSDSPCKPSPDPHPFSLDPLPSASAAAVAIDHRPNLIRHSSSPAGFFSHLMLDNGYSVNRGLGNYSQVGADDVRSMANRRLQSQLSFSRQDSLSQISEISIPDIGDSIGNGKSTEDVAQSYIQNFPIGSWDETNSIVFSAPSKRIKDNNGDAIHSLNNLESQFSLPKTSLEMASVEKLLQGQQDFFPFKIRAKRGCATHPRSIAERERRTRISEKLRKLQELVPNMDKQTNTSDMLDLAVQHIKTLQGQVQKLTEERANCTCASKQEMA
ncbi:transcription factor bHLH128-like [Dioscorea cayenensis subsp. rotundata]|uniref:Transcription factor bHLH128-like n=1 Tax=Dioscorea cayennensis subsp. rotundata TaxID=55577 RepID=A0AB40BZR0_DIOCR|nr:transcription factor bHLH128-like [Dioscorea cayenensis subsp. rotundata]